MLDRAELSKLVRDLVVTILPVDRLTENIVRALPKRAPFSFFASVCRDFSYEESCWGVPFEVLAPPLRQIMPSRILRTQPLATAEKGHGLGQILLMDEDKDQKVSETEFINSVLRPARSPPHPPG
jgi:hypothetical protein